MNQLAELHEALEPDVGDAPWQSNCAGEIFLEGGGAMLRIGHFQGDANIAAFVVAAHNAQCAARNAGAHRLSGAAHSGTSRRRT